jgi:hypothetical protein
VGVEAEVIVTRRLTLLPLAPHYAEEMAVVLGDPALHRYIGGAPLGVEELRARYVRLAAGSGQADVAWCNWVVRLDAEDRLAGTVQATVTGARAEVAWVVGAAWQGRGIATEAARGMVGWLRGGRGVDGGRACAPRPWRVRRGGRRGRPGGHAGVAGRRGQMAVGRVSTPSYGRIVGLGRRVGAAGAVGAISGRSAGLSAGHRMNAGVAPGR